LFSRPMIYNRQGSEKRLHDLWSLGIGGHINPVDQQNQQSSFKDILVSGMERELGEELAKRPKQDIAGFSGIISEDITDVGKVHFGAVVTGLKANWIKVYGLKPLTRWSFCFSGSWIPW
jgi:predicted NUDIX family phosphoesterase